MNTLRILLINTLRILLTALAGVATSASAATFVVNRTDDDGSTAHTLRWAILQSNNTRGLNRIEIRPPGNTHGEWVIQPTSLLPHIVGPAVIEGLRRNGHGDFDDHDDHDHDHEGNAVGVGDSNAPEVVIDGSKIIDATTMLSCPAENGIGYGPNVHSLQKPMLAVVDSGNVEISGLEIRNICIGIMLLRSHDNHIHHNVIHDTLGAASVLITGAAGDAAGSSTVGLSTNNLVEYNTIYDTGDGGECTRGSTNCTYQFNRFFMTSQNTIMPRSQGVESTGGPGNHDIKVIGNRFSGFSDGVQLQVADDVLVEGNVITATTYGITSSGTGIIIRNNVFTGNRMGVGPANTTRVTITRNAIYGNGQPILLGSGGGTTDPKNPAVLGIDVGVSPGVVGPGVTPNQLGASCADGFPDCGPVQNFPVLGAGSSWQPNGMVTLVGTLPSRPNAKFTIEFYASHALNAAGFAEGEVYLGSLPVTTDATGYATFNFVVPTTKRDEADGKELPPRSIVVPPTNPLRDGSSRAIFTATATNANGATSEFSAGLWLAR